jgi:hypothetical protein
MLNHKRSPTSADTPGAAPSAGLLRVLGAVFAAFLGIRKRASGERDAVTIKLVQVVIAGVLGAAILIAGLLTVVWFVTHRH